MLKITKKQKESIKELEEIFDIVDMEYEVLEDKPEEIENYFKEHNVNMKPILDEGKKLVKHLIKKEDICPSLNEEQHSINMIVIKDQLSELGERQSHIESQLDILIKNYTAQKRMRDIVRYLQPAETNIEYFEKRYIKMVSVTTLNFTKVHINTAFTPLITACNEQTKDSTAEKDKIYSQYLQLQKLKSNEKNKHSRNLKSKQESQ